MKELEDKLDQKDKDLKYLEACLYEQRGIQDQAEGDLEAVKNRQDLLYEDVKRKDALIAFKDQALWSWNTWWQNQSSLGQLRAANSRWKF